MASGAGSSGADTRTVTSTNLRFIDECLTNYLSTYEETGGVGLRFELGALSPAPTTVSSAACESCDSPIMSTPANRQHVVHQDYIVRQRYSNALPPPPGAVKLMQIPTEGISAYTSPAYASRMARAQPINIEADALLGMNIDLVGLPGIFDGDESCKFVLWQCLAPFDLLS